MIEEMESIVNILPLSRCYDVEKMLSRVLNGIEQFACVRDWHGRHVSFSMQFDAEKNVLTFGRGRYRLPYSTIRFISEDMDHEKHHDVNHVQQWASRYHQLILVVDAQELLESYEFRHEVTARRLALQERYNDVTLMLMDVDNIMEIEDTGDYATTYVGVNAAFGNKPYNKSRLHNVYQNTWNEVYSLGLAQDLLPYMRRFSKRPLYLPLLLLCHSDQHQQMGYQELLLSCINHAMHSRSYQLSNLSTLKSYCTMPGFNFNVSFIKKLKEKFLNGKHIRLAVIGLTGSGKTYLLSDMVVTNQRLGFTAKNAPGATNKRSATSFINDIEMARTPIYACRPNNVYSTLYSKDDQHFSLEFVDVPGEVVTKESILNFLSIVSALSDHTTEIFLERTWVNGKKQWKTVEVIHKDETKGSPITREVNSDNQDGIDLGGNQSDNQQSISEPQQQSSFFVIDGTRTQAYELNNAKIFKGLREQNFEETGSRMVSGQTILTDFEEYLTDTVINAIIEAWDKLGIQTRAGVDKNKFKTDYKDHFYFHYYTFFATDVIICDRCAKSNKELSDENNSATVIEQKPVTQDSKNQSSVPQLTTFENMVSALKELFEVELSEVKDIQEKRLYLAFRGVDSLMKSADLQGLLDEGFSLNMLYSLFVLHLFGKINSAASTSNRSTRFGKRRQPAVCPFNMSADFWLAICERPIRSPRETVICQDLFNEYQNGIHDSFVKSAGFKMTSTYDLYNHFLKRIEQFLVLPFSKKDVLLSSFGKKYLQGKLPPHVYFTATPINMEFEVSENHSNPFVYTFVDSWANDPFQRICFGTNNLVVDMLKANQIKVKDPVGKLLAFCYSH